MPSLNSLLADREMMLRQQHDRLKLLKQRAAGATTNKPVAAAASAAAGVKKTMNAGKAPTKAAATVVPIAAAVVAKPIHPNRLAGRRQPVFITNEASLRVQKILIRNQKRAALGAARLAGNAAPVEHRTAGDAGRFGITPARIRAALEHKPSRFAGAENLGKSIANALTRRGGRGAGCGTPSSSDSDDMSSDSEDDDYSPSDSDSDVEEMEREVAMRRLGGATRPPVLSRGSSRESTASVSSAASAASVSSVGSSLSSHSSRSSRSAGNMEEREEANRIAMAISSGGNATMKKKKAAAKKKRASSKTKKAAPKKKRASSKTKKAAPKKKRASSKGKRKMVQKKKAPKGTKSGFPIVAVAISKFKSDMRPVYSGMTYIGDHLFYAYYRNHSSTKSSKGKKKKSAGAQEATAPKVAKVAGGTSTAAVPFANKPKLSGGKQRLFTKAEPKIGGTKKTKKTSSGKKSTKRAASKGKGKKAKRSASKSKGKGKKKTKRSASKSKGKKKAGTTEATIVQTRPSPSKKKL